MATLKSLKTCSFCSKSVYKLAARGLCANCYYREKRNGTPDYVKVRKPCTVEGCESLSIAKGLCEVHYRRFQRSGVAVHERFDRWGHTTQHPLQHTFRWIIRAHAADMPSDWREDFWAFVRDVGERPTPKHKLVRISPDQPYSAGNVTWRAPAIEATEEQLAGKAGYMRAWNAANPRRTKGYYLKRQFGLPMEAYDKLLVLQNNGCAICKQSEVAINPKTGLARDLAVDHCHSGGHVRGLLCSACNTAIGLLNDDPDRLKAAIKYLRRKPLKL